ncbi:translation initiation factor [Candidatus Woesearchaeota archaeon]|nr:translation initiation factor [Candidatus Woesearchaeota archaeon]
MNEICPKCGLPKELCMCETIAKEAQRIVISIERKKFGKNYTVVTGIDHKEVDLKDLLKSLKSKLACGGTAKGNVIELQGVHKLRVKDILVKMGFPSDRIDVR